MLWLLILALTFALSGLGSAQSCPDCSYSALGSRYFFLSNFTYYDSVVYSTPAHLAVAYGTVSFDFYNSAAEGTVTCQATSSQAWSFFYGNVKYECEDSTGQANAIFTFNQTDGAVAISDTWSCAGNQYIGYATGEANLECDSNFWQNPNWTSPDNGSPYSTRNTTCEATGINLVPTFRILGW